MKHRWTLGVFDDGSGVWLCEWRDEFVYRCHVPRCATPRDWETDQSIERFRGLSKQTADEISSKLAHELLKAWAKSRKAKNGGWIDL